MSKFGRCVSPRLKDVHDSEFPVSMHRHLRNPHRSMIPKFGNVLCFHIAEAILSYYDICNGNGDPHSQSIEYVIALSKDMKSAKVVGDKDNGFALINEGLA